MKATCFADKSSKFKKIKQLKSFFDVLNDVNRLRILCLLKPGKELCVCDIFKALNLPQNLASYHLSLLKNSGFLISRRNGNMILYSRDTDFIEKKIDQLSKL